MSSRAGLAPELFTRAVAELAAADLRPEITVAESPAPVKAAPFAAAVTANICLPADPDHESYGRFILLFNPSPPGAWQGQFRVVTLAQVELEPEFGADPLLGSVGWSWLVEALNYRGAPFRQAGGTVTKVISECFAELATRPPTVELEIRASWTPTDHHLGRHLAGWCDALCTAAGLPPPGVTALQLD